MRRREAAAADASAKRGRFMVRCSVAVVAPTPGGELTLH